MVFRGRHGNTSGGSSLTWFLLVVVSLLVVVGVQPSPYPTYEDRLPYDIGPEEEEEIEDAPREIVSPLGFDEDRRADSPSSLSRDLEFGSSKPERYAEIILDRPSESNRNLQQILRSFPLVVGGPSPSDRIMPLSWSSLEEATMAQRGRSVTGVSSPSLPKGATLTHLTFGEPRPKRVMCHFKICNLGRRRRARMSSPLQGWLS